MAKAFKREWWQSTKIIQANADGTLTFLAAKNVGGELSDDQYELGSWYFSLCGPRSGPQV